MPFPSKIERWRKFARWEAKDIPIDLVLAIIGKESGGRVGAISGQQRKKGWQELPTDAGTTELAKYDYGLMQVSPPVVNAFNRYTKQKITLDDLTGDDERAARLQIQIGSWYYAAIVNKLHQFDPTRFPGATVKDATPDQLQLALVGYNGGYPGLENRLDALRTNKKPLSIKALYAAYPGWTAIRYASRVWGAYTKYAGPGDPRVAAKTPSTLWKSAQESGLVIPAALLLGWYFLSKNKEAEKAS